MCVFHILPGSNYHLQTRRANGKYILFHQSGRQQPGYIAPLVWLTAAGFCFHGSGKFQAVYSALCWTTGERKLWNRDGERERKMWHGWINRHGSSNKHTAFLVEKFHKLYSPHCNQPQHGPPLGLSSDKSHDAFRLWSTGPQQQGP